MRGRVRLGNLAAAPSRLPDAAVDVQLITPHLVSNALFLVSIVSFSFLLSLLISYSTYTI